jgi:hypothetical protein
MQAAASDASAMTVDERVVRKMLRVNPDIRRGRTTLQVKRALEFPLGAWTEGRPPAGARILYASTWEEYCKHQTAETCDPRTGRWEPRETETGRVAQRANHFWDTCWMSFAVLDVLRWKLEQGNDKRKYGVVGKFGGET